MTYRLENKVNGPEIIEIHGSRNIYSRYEYKKDITGNIKLATVGIVGSLRFRLLVRVVHGSMALDLVKVMITMHFTGLGEM